MTMRGCLFGCARPDHCIGNCKTDGSKTATQVKMEEINCHEVFTKKKNGEWKHKGLLFDQQRARLHGEFRQLQEVRRQELHGDERPSLPIRRPVRHIPAGSYERPAERRRNLREQEVRG